MKSRYLLTLACAGALTACQTTGDPTQGGLFGWSEKKAQARQTEREDTLAGEQQAARKDQQQAAALHREVRMNSADLADQQTELSQLLASVESLEREAPTPATASRARRLHRAIDAVRNDDALSVDQRWTLLRRYSAEVDLMRSSFAAPAH